MGKARLLLDAVRWRLGIPRLVADYPSQPAERIDELPQSHSWGAMLSEGPLIFAAWPAGGLRLGIATALGPLLHGRPVHFLMLPSWAWEAPGEASRLVAAARTHRRAFPRHRFHFICSTFEQERIFAKARWPAATINSNLLVDDSIFRPLAGTEPRFDAIYNARLSPGKRHELATLVESLCLLYFRDSGEQDPSQFRAEYARVLALLPHAEFLNPLTPDGCEMLPGQAVNRAYNQARVGLCLSAIEGQMRASMEYMLSGLAVISTRSLGGRDYFFDDEYCSVVSDDPRAVRDAVQAAIARGIPRSHIRTRTLVKVERERRRFIAYVQEIIDRGGGHLDFSTKFAGMLKAGTLMAWVSTQEFAASVLEALRRAKEAGTRPTVGLSPDPRR